MLKSALKAISALFKVFLLKVSLVEGGEKISLEHLLRFQAPNVILTYYISISINSTLYGMPRFA